MLVVQLSGLCASLWEMTQDYQRMKKMIYSTLILLLVATPSKKLHEEYMCLIFPLGWERQ